MAGGEESEPVDPVLVPLFQAIVRLAYARQQRELMEAAPELAELGMMLQLDNEPDAWKRRAEHLMKAFYNHVPENDRMPLRAGLSLIIAAVAELGRNASDRRIAHRAVELARLENRSSPTGRRKPSKPVPLAEPPSPIV